MGTSRIFTPGTSRMRRDPWQTNSACDMSRLTEVNVSSNAPHKNVSKFVKKPPSLPQPTHSARPPCPPATRFKYFDSIQAWDRVRLGSNPARRAITTAGCAFPPPPAVDRLQICSDRGGITSLCRLFVSSRSGGSCGGGGCEAGRKSGSESDRVCGRGG